MIENLADEQDFKMTKKLPGVFKIKTNRTFKIEHPVVEIRNQLNR